MLLVLASLRSWRDVGRRRNCAVGAARGMGKRRFEMYFRTGNAAGVARPYAANGG